MSERAKAFRCICEECEPLPPIPGLSIPEPQPTKARALGAALLKAAIGHKPAAGQDE